MTFQQLESRPSLFSSGKLAEFFNRFSPIANLRSLFSHSNVLQLVLAGLKLAACNHDELPNKENVTKRFQVFESSPDEMTLRRLLNLRTDGKICYLHMALMGNAFARHSGLFRSVGTNLATDLERRSFRWLADRGYGVFEYCPERGPETFDEVFRNSTWRENHHTRLFNGD